MYRILIVEDNLEYSLLLKESLERKGYNVTLVATANSAIRSVETAEYHVIILDIGLPDGSGLDVCKEIRKHYKTPIIMLTAWDQDDDVVKGLQTGADDYVIKPCSFSILESRIASQIRRIEWQNEQLVPANELFCGDIRFDVMHRMLYRQGEALNIYETELSLCEFFMINSGVILPREMILEVLWDSQGKYIDDNTLSVYISRLRKKLGLFNGKPYIDTVKGIGYRWNFKVTKE